MAATKTIDGAQLVLCGFGRTPLSPDASPFVLKAETFLRLTKLPYTFKAAGRPGGASGRLPNLLHTTAEGKTALIEDSQRMISYAKTHFGVDLDTKLSDEDRIVGDALLQVLQSSLYHCIVRFRWVDNFDAVVIRGYPLGLPMAVKDLILRRFGRPSVIKQLNEHGNGDLTNEEYLQVMLRDVQFVEWQVKQSKRAGGAFILPSSGSEPSSYDATTFAMVSAVVDQPAGIESPASRYAKASPVIQEYLKRVRDAAFPDWEELKAKGQKNLDKERKSDWAGPLILGAIAAVAVAAIAFGVSFLAKKVW